MARDKEMTHANEIEIEVLKQEVSTVRSILDGVNAKIDQVLVMQTSITQLQERVEFQRQAVDRAFSSIQEVRDKTTQASINIDRAMAFVKGGAVIGGLLFGFVQWYAFEQINSIKETSNALIAIDRRLMFIETKIWPDQSGKEK